MLISSSQFSVVVGIGLDRLEQRRLRERAAADLAESLGEGDLAMMPITPTEFGQHARYDYSDCLALRIVVMMEGTGFEFGAASRFIRRSGLSAFAYHDDRLGDFFLAQWSHPDTIRQTYGTAAELKRAMPESPAMATVINVSSIAADVAKRARAQLGLAVSGFHFISESAT